MSANQSLQLHSFDGAADQAEEEAFDAEQLAAARAEGYAEGRDAALAEHLATEERRIAELLEQITRNAAQLADTNDEIVAALTSEVLDIAMLAVRKVLPATAATNGLAEIENLVRGCLSDLRAEPRVAIRLHVTSLEALRPRLEQVATADGFDGKLVLLADDDLAPTDCQVLWADGGASRTVADVANAIDAAVDRFFNRDPATAESPQEQPAAQNAESPAASGDVLPPDPAAPITQDTPEPEPS